MRDKQINIRMSAAEVAMLDALVARYDIDVSHADVVRAIVKREFARVCHDMPKAAE